MASNATRVRQRAQAVNRLIEAAKAAAESAGVEAVAIPTHHREPDYLQTLQIEAAADLLERIAKGAAPAESSDADSKQDETAKPATTTAKTSATSTTRRAEKPAKASKG